MVKVTIGIDIGGTNTVLGIVDEEGTIYGKEKIKTREYPEISNFVNALDRSIRELMQKPESSFELKGIGIGAPNGNYYHGTIENPANLPWEGITPICDLFKKHYHIPVALTNDANAAAIGEMVYGGANGMKNFIVYTLGTGLGSGIVVNGELLYGHTGFAGEIGHIMMVPDGRDCGCGRKGCLENYVSATGICRTVGELLAEKIIPSSLRSVSPEELTSKMITDAAKKGDPVALEAFNSTARMLALSIVNAVAFSSPEAIFLFGGLAQAGNLIFEPTRKYIDEMVMINYKGSFKLLPSRLRENDAAILGASALAWKEGT